VFLNRSKNAVKTWGRGHIIQRFDKPSRWGLGNFRGPDHTHIASLYITKFDKMV